MSDIARAPPRRFSKPISNATALGRRRQLTTQCPLIKNERTKLSTASKMKKIKLNLDELQVQSFDTMPTSGHASRKPGTVHGQDTDVDFCVSVQTDDATCYTCAGNNTCGGDLGCAGWTAYPCGGGGGVSDACHTADGGYDTCINTCDGLVTCNTVCWSGPAQTCGASCGGACGTGGTCDATCDACSGVTCDTCDGYNTCGHAC
jgi:hypothetical protein